MAAPESHIKSSYSKNNLKKINANSPFFYSLGGQICNGFPGGLEIAQKLFPKVWISAHDGEKEVKGLATLQIATTKFEREEVERVVSPRTDKFSRELATRAVVLEVGEEIFLNQRMDFDDIPKGLSSFDRDTFVSCNSA